MMILIKLLLLLSGLLSRGIVEKGSQGVTKLCMLYIILLYSLLMLQDCFKMLVFDRLGLFPFIPAFLQYSPQIYPHSFDTMHFSIVPMLVLRVLWMSTHGCFAILFPIPTWWNQTMESRSQTPPQMPTTRRVLTVLTTGSSQLARTS